MKRVQRAARAAGAKIAKVSNLSIVSILSMMAMVPVGPAAAEGEAAEAPAEVGPAPAAVLELAYLTDLAQELYWWYLDEEVMEMRRGAGFAFSVRRLAPELDEGDQSEWAEIRVPAFGLGVVVKRPDYRIEETGAEVRGRHFRISEVFRLEGGRAPTDGLPGGPWTRVEFGAGEMLKRVRERLGELRFPDEVLMDRLDRMCQRQVEIIGGIREHDEQVIHIAPLSDVANDVWAYFDNQCWLVQFSTDRELEQTDGWSWEDFRVRIWDLRVDTVGALGELPGSNLAMTLDQAGRALYNCVVLGKRLVVVKPEEPDGEWWVKEHVWGD